MKFILLVILSTMCGCAISGTGKVISLHNDDVIQLEMEFGRTSTSMSGVLRSTGETFEGGYEATWNGTPGMDTSATGNGYLIGNQGTRLNCQTINIMPGNMIFRTQAHGTGMCFDRSKRPYRLTF